MFMMKGCCFSKQWWEKRIFEKRLEGGEEQMSRREQGGPEEQDSLCEGMCWCWWKTWRAVLEPQEQALKKAGHVEASVCAYRASRREQP